MKTVQQMLCIYNFKKVKIIRIMFVAHIATSMYRNVLPPYKYKCVSSFRRDNVFWKESKNRTLKIVKLS